MKIKRLDKLPKRKVTVEEILGYDDITQCISGIVEIKDSIDELLICYREGDAIHWQTSCMPLSRVIYMLEVTKNALLNEGD